MCVALLAGVGGVSHAATPVIVTVNQIADSYVEAAKPTRNNGTASTLFLDGSPVERAYLRFTVPAFSGTIAKATLRVYVTTGSSAGFSVHGVADDTWGERQITYSNAPLIGSPAAASGVVGSGWKDLDVTSLVTGSGNRSIALTTAGATALKLVSREGTNSRIPQLVVETLDSTAPAVTLSQPASGATTALSPTFTGAAGTAAGDSSQVTLRIWSGSAATGTPVQTRTATQSAGSWSVAASPALAPGTYTARAEQTDGAGNTGQSAAVTFTADAPDTTPPAAHPLPARKRRDHGSEPDLHGRCRDRGRRLESGHA